MARKSTPFTRSRSTAQRTPTDAASGSKRQRVGNFEPEVSSGMSDSSFERHAKETTSTKVMSKLILKERLCDLDLLKKIGIADLFDSVGCSSLLSPPEIIYPELVKEFYAKLRILDGNIVFSEVQGNPVCFKADLLARLTGVSDKGVCLSTTHQAFQDIPGLQYEE